MSLTTVRRDYIFSKQLFSGRWAEFRQETIFVSLQNREIELERNVYIYKKHVSVQSFSLSLYVFSLYWLLLFCLHLPSLIILLCLFLQPLQLTFFFYQSIKKKNSLHLLFLPLPHIDSLLLYCLSSLPAFTKTTVAQEFSDHLVLEIPQVSSVQNSLISVLAGSSSSFLIKVKRKIF